MKRKASDDEVEQQQRDNAMADDPRALSDASGRWADLDKLLLRPGKLVGPGFEPSVEVREISFLNCLNSSTRIWTEYRRSPHGSWECVEPGRCHISKLRPRCFQNDVMARKCVGFSGCPRLRSKR